MYDFISHDFIFYLLPCFRTNSKVNLFALFNPIIFLVCSNTMKYFPSLIVQCSRNSLTPKRLWRKQQAGRKPFHRPLVVPRWPCGFFWDLGDAASWSYLINCFSEDPSIHTCISIYLSIYQPMYSYTQPFIYQSIHLSTSLSVYKSIDQSTFYLSINPSIN